MTGPRAITAPILGLAGTALLGVLAVPAAAQVNEGIVLNIMRECAKIDDATARLACYDNNIRSAGAAPARNSVPGRMESPGGGGGSAPVSTAGRAGFGAEDIRTEQRFESRAGELSGVTARVTSVTEREPGVYRFTLEDGAQWIFSESVESYYRPPRRGSTVEINRGSLGSFLMRFDEQPSVPVRRER